MGNLDQVLLEWYARNARNLPWREHLDPYSIWISEIMLQQTRVNTVIPYYTKWMAKFPDIIHIEAYTNQYTFFNDGPDQSFFDTLERTYHDIKNIAPELFDCAVISAGAYGCFIADFVENILNKPSMVLGGQINQLFGIKCGRSQNRDANSDLLISVPEYMKPVDHMKIENCCYW